MTVHPLRRPAAAPGTRATATPVLPRPRPARGSAEASAAPRGSVPAAVLDALGAPAPERQGPPAARVPVTLLLSLAGRCACADCVGAYTEDVRRSRLRAVSA